MTSAETDGRLLPLLLHSRCIPVAFPLQVRYHAQPSLTTAWEREEEEVTLHVSRCAFAAGGERNVFHARLEGSSFAWVAKVCTHPTSLPPHF